MIKKWGFRALFSYCITFSLGFCGSQSTQSTPVSTSSTQQKKGAVTKASSLRTGLLVGAGLTLLAGCLYYANQVFLKEKGLHDTTGMRQVPERPLHGQQHKPVDGCAFCDVIYKSAQKPLLDTDSIIIIKSTNRGQPLVIPKKHLTNVRDMSEQDKTLLWKIIEGLQTLARRGTEEIKPTPCFRVEVNNGSKAGQAVFHMHWHFFRGEGSATPQVDPSKCALCQHHQKGDASADDIAVIEKHKSRFLIFPKKHNATMLSLTQSDTDVLWHMVQKAQQLANGNDFNIYINTGSGTADKNIHTPHNSFTQEYPHMYWEVVVR